MLSIKLLLWYNVKDWYEIPYDFRLGSGLSEKEKTDENDGRSYLGTWLRILVGLS